MSSRLHPEEDPEKAELLMDPELGTAAASSSTSRRQSSHSPSAAGAAANPDFMLIKIVARIALSLIRRYRKYFRSLYSILLFPRLKYFCALDPKYFSLVAIFT